MQKNKGWPHRKSKVSDDMASILMWAINPFPICELDKKYSRSGRLVSPSVRCVVWTIYNEKEGGLVSVLL